MTDTFWASMIAASAALLGSLITQLVAARSASKLARQAAENEALQWRRSESKREREWRQGELRALWSHALQARTRMADNLAKGTWGQGEDFAGSATGAAAQVYAVALVGLPGVREAAKVFYVATTKLDAALTEAEKMEAAKAWRVAFDGLEEAVIRMADSQSTT